MSLSDNTTVCFYWLQDTIHIGTKIKTLFLNRGRSLIMGTMCASTTYVQDVIDNVSKEHHGLTQSDLNPKDKMNFQAVLRLTDDRVLAQLRRIPDADATELFLCLIGEALDAFLQPQMPPLDRISSMWKLTFFLRLWRQWLIEENHELQQCFLTPQTYLCIELNAHAIVQAVVKMRDCSCRLLPHLFSSQPCEKCFRAARSLTSTFATVVNFSMLQLLSRLRRIDLQTHIVHALKGKYVFPR